MSENERQPGSPLAGERGTTTIGDTVVSTIASMAAQEVEGVYMGGSASRAAGGLLSNITGSESQTRGISVQVGRLETAIDLTMGIEYGSNILQTVENVRRRVSERVQSMTGLRVTELNATVSDIVFPEGGERRRRALEDGSSRAASGPLSEEETEERSPEADETTELRPEDVAAARRASGRSERREQG